MLNAPKLSKKETHVGVETLYLFLFSMSGSETTIKIVFLRTAPEEHPPKHPIHEHSRNPDVGFPSILTFFFGHDAGP